MPKSTRPKHPRSTILDTQVSGLDLLSDAAMQRLIARQPRTKSALRAFLLNGDCSLSYGQGDIVVSFIEAFCRSDLTAPQILVIEHMLNPRLSTVASFELEDFEELFRSISESNSSSIGQSDVAILTWLKNLGTDKKKLKQCASIL